MVTEGMGSEGITGGEKGQVVLTVDPGQPKEALGDFYGIFFEDINHAADGGLYAELVRNGNFEFSPIDNGSYRSLTAWEKVEKDGRTDWMVASKDPVSRKNPHYLVLHITGAGGRVGVRNTGYYGGIPSGSLRRLSPLRRVMSCVRPYLGLTMYGSNMSWSLCRERTSCMEGWSFGQKDPGSWSLISSPSSRQIPLWEENETCARTLRRCYRI